MGLALAGDVIFSAESAKFMAGFMRLGAMPDYGIMYSLPCLVGLARAKNFCSPMAPGRRQMLLRWGLSLRCCQTTNWMGWPWLMSMPRPMVLSRSWASPRLQWAEVSSRARRIWWHSSPLANRWHSERKPFKKVLRRSNRRPRQISQRLATASIGIST